MSREITNSKTFFVLELQEVKHHILYLKEG